MEEQKSVPKVAEQPLEFESEEEETDEPEGEVVEEDAEEEKKATRPMYLDLPETQTGGAPPWVLIPKGMKFPKGRQVLFIRIPGKWTDAPKMGKPLPVEDDESLLMNGTGGPWRQAILWSLSVGDEKLAMQRALGDGNRLAPELAKQMIRAIDGAVADWSGMPGDGQVEVFWDQIGSRGRMLLNQLFSRLHVLPGEDQKRFIESCVAVRSAG
jgi:hypothetical protein